MPFLVCLCEELPGSTAAALNPALHDDVSFATSLVLKRAFYGGLRQ